ncbi:MAG: signal transduction histidine kinase [Bacteroidetes bacterium]|nr:MAG: signal transduction histidine kinase [Bacteroidota bacterium]
MLKTPALTLRFVMIMRLLLVMCCISVGTPLAAQKEDPKEQKLRAGLAAVKSDSAKARLSLDLAHLLRFKNPGEAQKLASEAIRIDSLAGNYSRMSHGCLTLGNVMRNINKFDSCIIMYDRAIELGQQAGDPAREAKALTTKARFYQILGAYPVAIKSSLDAIRAAHKSEDNELKSIVHTDLAGIYLGSHAQIPHGDNILQLARNHLDTALKFALLVPKCKALPAIYGNLGEVYFRLEMYDEAERYDRLALYTIMNTNGKDKTYAEACALIGAHAQNSGKADTAEKYLLEALHVYDSVGAKTYAPKALIKLANLYVSKENPGKAEPYARRLYAIARAQKNNLHLQEFYSVYSQATALRGQYQLALRYMDTANIYRDSVAINTQVDAMENAERMYQLGLMELEKKYKTKEQAAQIEEEKKSKKDMLLFSAAIITALLIIILVAYYAYRQKKKAGAELLLKNKVIAQQSADKDVFLSEIHHRVKNNLQLISSMLNLQMNAVQRPELSAALQESLLRVKSISLVHQQLYHTNDIASVQLQEYLTLLTDNLTNTLKEHPAEVKISVQPATLQLDLDTAISVGLIVNELLTNSLKYAANNGDTIVVQLSVEQTAPGHYRMLFSDNGPGLPADFDLKTINSLGIRLVRQLCKQLKGTVEITGTRAAAFSFTFLDASARKQIS